MNSQKYNHSSLFMLIEIYPVLGIVLGLALVLILQTSSNKICIQFPSAPNRGIPERTSGAGTRITIKNPLGILFDFR